MARWLRRARIRLDCETSDLCQSAVRRLLERRDRFPFDSEKEFVQYVVRSAENLARMKQRAQHRQPINVVPLNARNTRRITGKAAEPNEQAVARETLQLLRDRVTAEQWELLTRRAGGASWKQLAASLGLSPDATRQRHTRLIQRLRRKPR